MAAEQVDCHGARWLEPLAARWNPGANRCGTIDSRHAIAFSPASAAASMNETPSGHRRRWLIPAATQAGQALPCVRVRASRSSIWAEVTTSGASHASTDNGDVVEAEGGVTKHRDLPVSPKGMGRFPPDPTQP